MAWVIANIILVSLFAGLAGGSDAAKPARIPLAHAAEAAAPAPDLPVAPTKIAPDSLGVELTALSSALIDTRTGEVLFSEGHDRIAPIASITKLMTAIVFLETGPDWDAPVTMQLSDDTYEGIPYLKKGEILTVRDLFRTALIGSGNNAALALARVSGLGREAFVAKMNAKARELGLAYTTFTDPSGYLPSNTSTAFDVARLAHHAFESAEIRDTVTLKEHRFLTKAGVEKRIPSTNLLLSSFLNEGEGHIVGGKTGFTEEAGYTLVMRAKKGEGDVIAVVLGSATSEERFQDVKALLSWGFRTFSWNN